jgi:hypothetical protein
MESESQLSWYIPQSGQQPKSEQVFPLGGQFAPKSEQHSHWWAEKWHKTRLFFINRVYIRIGIAGSIRANAVRFASKYEQHSYSDRSTCSLSGLSANYRKGCSPSNLVRMSLLHCDLLLTEKGADRTYLLRGEE